MIQNNSYTNFREKIFLKILDNSNTISTISFFVLAFLLFYIDIDFRHSVFSERDISRAKAWLEGSFYWPGPELSGGSNLPGPFFYFLLFPAILMGDNTYSQVVLWTILWFSLTYTLAFFFLQKIVSHKESLLVFLITFIASRHVIAYSSMLNPEFAVMFHVLALITLYYWREKRNSLYLYLTGLIIALGIQIHLLTALPIITVFLFYIIDKSKNIKALLLFLFLALSPLLIFTILSHFHFFETSEKEYIEHTSSILKQIFSEKWMEYINQMVFPFIVLFTFCFTLNLWQKITVKERSKDSSFRNLFIITVVPFLFAFLVGRYNWYLLFIPVFANLVISKWMDSLKIRGGLLLSYSLFILLYFLFFNKEYIYSLYLFKRNTFALGLFLFSLFILLILNLPWHKKTFYKNILFCFFFCLFIKLGVSDFKGSFKLTQINFNQKAKHFSIPKNFYNSYQPFKNLYPIMKRIYLETGYPPETAMKKILIIGIHPEISLLFYYSMTVERLHTPSLSLLYDKELGDLKHDFIKNKTQGYFIIQHLQKFIDWTQDDWKNYLAHSSFLSHFLKQEIKDSKIIIKEPELYKKYWLIPYNIQKDSLFPEGFHNIGQPYYYEEPDWLKKCHQTKKFKNHSGFFYCRILPGHLQRAGLSIQWDEETHSNSLNIQFFGHLLGTVINSTNLDGSSFWSEVKINIMCGLQSKSYNLPDVGVLYKDWKNSEKAAKRFLAPLKMKLLLEDCNRKDQIKITFSFAETVWKTQKPVIVEWD